MVVGAVTGSTVPDTRQALEVWVRTHDHEDGEDEDEDDEPPSMVFPSRTLGGRGRLYGDLNAATADLLTTALDSLMGQIVQHTSASSPATPRCVGSSPDRTARSSTWDAAPATPSAAQWKALRVRDRHCRWWGCRRPATWCDAHHIRFWFQAEGPTDLEDLILPCRFHHTLIHRRGWQLTGTAQDFTITRPDGTHFPNAPP